ncbi:MAG: hypothetical protein LUI04_00710 [Porphyromonadaceae bacterium]|nr:hypothetical protein [Porphyromonadaceae bacterium]
MKTAVLKICLCSVLFLCCIACSEDDESPVVLVVSPESMTTQCSAGTNLLYEVEGYSTTSSPLRSFTVRTYDEERGLLSLLDTTLFASRFVYSFPYAVPEFSKDDITIQIRFELSDEAGNMMDVHRYVTVAEGTVELESYENISLYAPGSGGPDAYNLSSCQVLYRELADSSEVDIYTYKADEDTTASLSLEWRSYTGVKFVRYNEFNYATATQSAIESSYVSGMPQNRITDITANDVILIGKDTGAIGVIKILLVSDTDTARYYLFSWKKIKS